MLAALFAVPAHASLQLCNQTSYVLYAATGFQQASRIVTHGWLRIVPGDCATALSEPLKASAYFVYARSARDRTGERRAWGGQFQFCAMDGDFALRTPASASDCKIDGAFEVPFAPVATSGAQVWSMTFTESAGLVSPDDARNAGFVRLLNELDYPTGAGNKALPAALARFRATAHVPANANSSDLFAALEAEVVKSAAPKGYSICNDGDSKIWAALGLKSGAEFVSRGWWEIASGACELVLDNALGRDAVYLFASKHGNKTFVSGPQAFCISNAQFDIRGRDRCVARGLSEAGFFATNLKGRPGFTAHIANGGIVGQ